MLMNGQVDPAQVQASTGPPVPELLSDLAFLDLQGRLARQLLALANEGEAMARTRRVTQTELASMVSGARQTVNQALRSLEARGYIRADGRGFQILDRRRLEHLAER